MTRITDRDETTYRAVIGGQPMTFDTAEAKFVALADEWDEANAGRSRVAFTSGTYHQVIGMGYAAVPMLLGRLSDGDADWIYALKCITGEQAETPDMDGDHDRIVGAWLSWGAARGFRNGRV